MILQKYKTGIILELPSIFYTFSFIHIFDVDRLIFMSNILKSS